MKNFSIRLDTTGFYQQVPSYTKKRNFIYKMVIFGISFFFSCFARGQQNYPDSLSAAIDNLKADSEAIEEWIKLSKKMAVVDFNKALEIGKRALHLSQKKREQQKIARCHYHLGYLLLEYGRDYDLATNYFFKSLKYYEKSDDSKQLALIHYYLGYIFYRLQDNKQSLNYYNISEEFARRSNNPFVMAKIMNNLGNYFHSREKDYPKAMSYYMQSLEANLQSGDSAGIAHQYSNIGNIHLYSREYDKAYDFYRKGIAICKNNGYSETLSLLLGNLGNFYLWKDEYSKAEMYFIQSIEIAEKNDLKHKLLYPAKSLAELYENQGKYNLTFKYYQLHTQTLNDIKKKRHARDIVAMKWQYELDKQNEALKAKKQFAWVGFVFLFILGILAILYTRARLRQSRLKAVKSDLEQKILRERILLKNRKLVTQTIHMTRYGELINSIMESLRHLRYDLKKQNHEKLDKIIASLRLSKNNAIWEEFETHFESVHEDFYKKLDTHYPTLTANERKLCAFLKLNMSSKEMAAVTYKSLESINSARKRLRKKLKLQQGESLVAFVTQF